MLNLLRILNKVMKKLLFIGFCFLTGNFLAQEYEPGYIINLEKDTIKGYIIEKTDEELATGIWFKRNKNEYPEIYKPKDLEEFGFNRGRVFSSRYFPGKRKNDTSYIFAKNLVRGKIDLFVWSSPDRYKPDFFLENNETGRTAHLRRPERKKDTGTGNGAANKDEPTFPEAFAYVKGDTTTPAKDLRYSENKIRKEIISYNEGFEDQYPIEEYKAPIEINFNIMAGIPFQFDAGETNFRAAVYVNKETPERRENMLLTYGVVYHYNQFRREIPEALQEGEIGLESHLLNIIPLAIKFQGGSGLILAYGYAGVGVAVDWETNLLVENSAEAGIFQNTRFFPTLNTGIGAKIKTRSGAVITELTPTLNGIFFNLGFSF